MPGDNTRITSVKDTEKKVTLIYEEIKGADQTTTAFKSGDRPTAPFTNAMNAFAAPTLKVLGISGKMAFTVRTVKCSYDEEEGELKRVEVHLLKEVAGSNRPLNIHSPLLELSEFDQFIPLLEELHKQCEEFRFGGKRAQTDAFEKAA